ncbi:N-terminal acetyltransferase [Tulasnella sp. 330]|nr:N-terminal acetyltransferase [Tulasnella sp. 330]
MLKINPSSSYYNDEQLSAYLLRVGLPSAIDHKPSLDNAETLIRHHITTIPFENTEMHYTASGFLDCDPQVVYTRIVEDNEGGTNCHGLHLLLLGMLLKLGYRGYFIMARVNQMRGPPEVINLGNLDHSAIVIQVPGNDETYLVDIGMGLGFTQPARLAVDFEFDAFAGKRYRLIRARHPESPVAGEEGEDWRLQMNTDLDWNFYPDSIWRTVMQFSMQPFFMKDLLNLTWLVHHNPDHILRKGLVVMMFIKNEKGVVIGQQTIMPKGKAVTLRTAAGLEVLREFGDEDDRIAALKDLFGIKCPADAKACISGRPSAIKVDETEMKNGT